MRLAAATVTTAALLLLAALALPAAAPAAESQRCKRVSHERFGSANRIRLTEGFRCRDARSDLRRWLRAGASTYGQNPFRIAPWECTTRSTRSSRINCKLRTSFGGTRPERTYTLRFTYRPE